MLCNHIGYKVGRLTDFITYTESLNAYQSAWEWA